MAKGRRLIKLLIAALLLALLFGGGIRWVIAGGARSLDMADRLIGSGDGARLLVADQRYGHGTRQYLDIWAPGGVREGDRLPVVVFFYGGGWSSGEREHYGFAGRALAQQGFIVVIPDYRLAPRAQWPDFLQDSAEAVAWTHAHIGALGGDPDRIALMGHSAGAYNAAMLALDPQWLRDAGSDPSVVRGVAGLAGPYDFLPLEKGGSADRAMGKVRPVERTQPIAFARGDAPPMWLATGDADTRVRPRNSQNLAAAIERAGGSAALRLYPGIGHTGIVMALARPFRGRAPVLDDATDFLRGVTGRRIAPAKGIVP
ncbi:MAG: alpha/beta hydrolase [Sphingopyxis sp.]|uniref:alpha/beta hydrolase n=1 Tax=Sphingopyxis sp. TaxID=1908224 RepID=UPI002ABADD9F|nr:alpha/beta hydrolase [Sphingopyxis sp.]MDZ3830289.1 alpha/beta hydrolase [Sphingopyxis sp.]